MKRILIVGGANGIGLAIATAIAMGQDCEKVYVVDKEALSEEYKHPRIESFQFDLTNPDYSFFTRFQDIDSMMITAGFGKLSLFRDVSEQHIIDSFNVNTVSVLRLVKQFYNKLESNDDFFCGIMVSISGFMSSPYFSIYGATKAALRIFIESVNVELAKWGTTNRILNVSPGSINGTSFNQGKTDLTAINSLAHEIITHLKAKDDLLIPKYEEIFKQILERYHYDFRAEGSRSYDYKVASGRIPVSKS